MTRTLWHGLALSLASVLAGCAAAPESIVDRPLRALPVARPLDIERPVTGSLFNPDAPVATLFSSDRLPRRVGDSLKVDIAESITASQKLGTETQRDNQLEVKGPGQGSKVNNAWLATLLDLDAKAYGKDSYKGSGQADNALKFNARMAVTVINVLANGHLVVAGERQLALNRGVAALRFSGVVNPADIRAGNVVGSADVVDARLELAGEGDVSDASSRSWMQRVIARSLAVW
jgi:flagellar L-ring protein FlgH